MGADHQKLGQGPDLIDLDLAGLFAVIVDDSVQGAEIGMVAGCKPGACRALSAGWAALGTGLAQQQRGKGQGDSAIYRYRVRPESVRREAVD